MYTIGGCTTLLLQYLRIPMNITPQSDTQDSIHCSSSSSTSNSSSTSGWLDWDWEYRYLYPCILVRQGTGTVDQPGEEVVGVGSPREGSLFSPYRTISSHPGPTAPYSHTHTTSSSGSVPMTDNPVTGGCRVGVSLMSPAYVQNRTPFRPPIIPPSSGGGSYHSITPSRRELVDEE